MAIENLFVLDHVQSFNGKPIHNIYTFRRSTIGTAQQLIDAFEDDLLEHIQDLQCAQIVTESLKVYCPGNPSVLDEETVGTPGNIPAVDMLPVFNAINFTLKPAGRSVRPGSKRIAGVPEVAQVDGVVTQAGYLGVMENLRLALAENISDNGTDFWEPMVVKRIRYIPEGNPEDKPAYRFPETDAELVWLPLRNVTTTPEISSQVSRKKKK